MAKIGRDAVFPGKDHATRIQGIMTRVGRSAFEGARRDLAALYASAMKRDIDPSDGDVVEYLARGRGATVQYLKRRKRTES